MAIDNNSLCYLFDSIFQVENVAGRPVVGGHIEVFIAGTNQKYITWQNFDGTKNPFKIPLNNDGRAVVLAEPHYTYDIYIYDSFNNMICSRLNVKPAIGGDVTVYGLTEVWHDGTMSGEGTPQSPLSVVSAGKVYDGIEPIVVNNIENKISAQHIPLGVEEPLYFVEDSETACIIGFSGETIPEGVMSESALGFENNKITGYNGSAFSAGNEYEAGSYVDITDNTISVTGLQPKGDYAYNSALSSKLDVTALPQDLVHSGDLTAYQPAGDYLSASDSANFLLTGDSANFLLTSDSGNFYPMEGNPSGFLTEHQSLDDYATKQWVEDKGYITGIDIQESANWNSTTETVSSNSAQWGASNPQIPVTGINGIKISESGDKVVFEVSGDYATHDDLTSKQDSLTYGYHGTAISSIDNSALYDSSAHARINTLAGRISDLSSNKLDESAFSDVSGDFATTGDLNDLSTSISETYQSKLTFDYNGDSAISAINGSALAGGGSITGDYVSGVNTVNIRPTVWDPEHRYEYTTIISGDVQVRTAEWYSDWQVKSGLYSLSAIGNELGNKLDRGYVAGSTTIKNINNHAEMGNNAYRPNGFNTISAYNIDVGHGIAYVAFHSYTDWLYSAIITVETNTIGNLPDNWTLQSFEDSSAILIRKYNNLGQENYESVTLTDLGGWNITNIDASAMTYSEIELAPIAFKDDITGITYTTGSI